MQNKKGIIKGFTLIELIVTITILAILGWIAFASMQGYWKYSRDVVRVSDLNNIKSVMEYSMTETWVYPSPDWEVEIKYDWTSVWSQWTFWKISKRKTKRLSNIPLDPLTQNEYTLSVSSNWQEYELAWAYEWDEVVNNPHLTSPHERGIIGEIYANTEWLKTRLIWNYNWKVKLIKHNNKDYVLALPSMVSIDLSDTSDDNLENIVNAEKLTYNWYNQLPASYWNTTASQSWNINITPNSLVAWSWSLEEMKKTWSWFTKLSTWLYSAYLWTDLYLEWDEFKYIDSSDVVKYILKSPLEEWNIYKNCKEIKQAKNSTTNWCYTITWNFIEEDKSCLDDTSTERYYCDMIKDWWGWTMYVKIKWNYEFDDAKNCVLWEKINNSELFCTVPFQFGKNKELWYQDLTTWSGYINNIDEEFNELISWTYSNLYKSTYFDLMYRIPNIDDIERVRLWINYMHKHSLCWADRHPGWQYFDWRYMNYDNYWTCSWPKSWEREDTARIWEFYVR